MPFLDLKLTGRCLWYAECTEIWSNFFIQVCFGNAARSKDGLDIGRSVLLSKTGSVILVTDGIFWRNWIWTSASLFRLKYDGGTFDNEIGVDAQDQVIMAWILGRTNRLEGMASSLDGSNYWKELYSGEDLCCVTVGRGLCCWEDYEGVSWAGTVEGPFS